MPLKIIILHLLLLWWSEGIYTSSQYLSITDANMCVHCQDTLALVYMIQLYIYYDWFLYCSLKLNLLL